MKELTVQEEDTGVLTVTLTFMSKICLQKGIAVINNLDNGKFEQFLHRILVKMKSQDPQIFTAEEQNKLEKIFKFDAEQITLAVKTVVYLFNKMLKYIFMPTDLQNDLKYLNIIDEKADCFVKVWSAETKSTLNELGSKVTEEDKDPLKINWKMNVELSSECQKKCKVPKVYLSLADGNSNTEVELTHPELYSIYLQLEAIQNELDNIIYEN